VNEFIIYCSQQQSKFLRSVEHWHIDATFFAVPVGYYHLIVILLYDDDTDLDRDVAEFLSLIES